MKTLEAIEYLKTQSEEIDWVFDKINTKAGKTRQQEKTYYKLFGAISKHLWYSLDEVKIYVLSGCFWTKKLKMNREEIEIPVISRTRDLTKEQWIFLIDTLISFAKIKNVPVKITSAEIDSLYNSYW